MANPIVQRFTDLPPEIATNLENIERKRRIQEALMAQTLQPDQTQMTGGRYSRAVPYSPLQGAMKLIQAAMLRKGQEGLDKELTGLGQQYRQGEQADITKVTDAMSGRAPYTDYPMMPDEQAIPGLKTETGTPDYKKAIMSGYASQYPAAQRMGEVAAALMPQQPKPMTVGAGAAVYQPGEGELYRNPNATASTNVNVNLPGQEKFAEEWAKLEVGNYGDHLKSAESAALNKPVMERFIASSDLASEGTVQPLFSFVKGIATSFGLDFESLTAENIGDQANSEILSRFMRELGARGLTDQDMKILRNSLPKMSQSKEARVAIANVMLKSYDKQIETFSDRFEQLATKPEVAHMAYKPTWLTSWEKQQQNDPLGIRK